MAAQAHAALAVERALEIADTDEERRTGLMFREEMGADNGMLFEYSEPQYITMWMANTILSLDMFFVGVDGRIINIAQRTVPHSRETISSTEPAISVLEVNAGTASRLGIGPGDLVLHPFFGTD